MGIANFTLGVLLTVGSTLMVASAAVANNDFALRSIWKLPGTPTEDRWLEVRSIDGSDANVLYHVSVLSRKKGSQVWDIKHIVPHMAITAAALRRSVVQLASGERDSYPESYDNGYRQWLQARSEGSAPICATSVIECAHL
jgi:Domain of unknown function (DUF5086)